jgi:hypothetical protein
MGPHAAFVFKVEHVSWALLGSAVLAFLVSGYLYAYAKQYEYLVEAPCDSATHECYMRDCEEEECPPNGLASYRLFAVPARLFPSCTDNGCLNVCLSEGSACRELKCSGDTESACEGPLL